MKKKASLIFSDKSLNLVFPTKNNNNSDSRHHREKESKIWPEVSVQVKKGPHSFIGQPWGIYSWLHHYDDVSVTFTTSCALISVRKIDDLWRAQNNHNNHCIVDKYRTSKYYTIIESSYPEKRLELAVNVRNKHQLCQLVDHSSNCRKYQYCCHQNFHFSVLRFWWILKLCRSIAWKFSKTFYFYFLKMASTANLTTINIVPSSLSCLLIAIILMCVCGFVVEMFQVILIKCSLLGCQEVCFACGVSCPSEILSNSFVIPVSPSLRRGGLRRSQ